MNYIIVNIFIRLKSVQWEWFVMKLKTLIGLLIGSLTTFFILSLLSNKLTNKEYWFYASIYLIFMVITYFAINFIRKVKSTMRQEEQEEKG